MPLIEYEVTLRIRTVDGPPDDWDWNELLDLGQNGEDARVLSYTENGEVEIPQEDR